jgi:hypothetical protein
MVLAASGDFFVHLLELRPRPSRELHYDVVIDDVHGASDGGADPEEEEQLAEESVEHGVSFRGGVILHLRPCKACDYSHFEEN